MTTLLHHITEMRYRKFVKKITCYSGLLMVKNKKKNPISVSIRYRNLNRYCMAKSFQNYRLIDLKQNKKFQQRTSRKYNL